MHAYVVNSTEDLTWPRYIHSHPAMKAARLLLWVLAACSAHVVICNTFISYGNEMDRLSLLAFKDAISLDPQQTFMSWNHSTHFCNWEGVLCRVKAPRRVTSLNLTSRGLVGHISPSLGNLTFMRSLALTGNTLAGEIPPLLGHLHRLQTLLLNSNTLQGRVPTFANCSKLKVMDVSKNNLVGHLHANLPLHFKCCTFGLITLLAQSQLLLPISQH